MGLRVHNSLTRTREDFEPLNPPRVGIYVCGPTVYGHSHLGHAKSYVSFDAIIRWLKFSGYEVNYVQNITDVGHLTDDADEGEDKIIAEARRRGLHPMAIADTFTQSYYEDMDALNLLRPDIAPHASGHIPEQIEAVRKLLEKGHAYEVNGSVFFDISSFWKYGRLSGRNIEEMEAGARVEVDPEKRHPADFNLWRRAEPGHIMQWPSPWGMGYPGWHIECTVMSQKYIGETLDIHGGGIENMFPHHECEIAQGECLTGQPFARVWLHNNMCTLNGQKMGKSLGNAITLKEIFHEGTKLLDKTFEPVVVRHFVLTSHYRQPLDFSSEALKGAESGSHKLRDAARQLARAACGTAAPTVCGTAVSAVCGTAAPAVKPEPEAPARAPIASAVALAKSDKIRDALTDIGKRFTDAMNEDFNTAAAIAVTFDLARQSGEWIQADVGQEDLQAAHTLMQRLVGDTLGFRWPAPMGAGYQSKQDDLIRLLADLRQEARQNKNYDLSDQIRDRLSALGVNLRDTPDGPKW
ncbi:MAG: cysteine--tRNA ligase [Planctomycetes bacterium]|nr:cysteine--tRNA ligase [Planctomycetota bacterium]